MCNFGQNTHYIPKAHSKRQFYTSYPGSQQTAVASQQLFTGVLIKQEGVPSVSTPSIEQHFNKEAQYQTLINLSGRRPGPSVWAWQTLRQRARTRLDWRTTSKSNYFVRPFAMRTIRQALLKTRITKGTTSISPYSRDAIPYR